MHCTQLLNYNLIIILLEQRHFGWLNWCFKIQAKNVSSWSPKKSFCFISLCVSHQHMVEKVEPIARRALSSGFIKMRTEWKYCYLEWSLSTALHHAFIHWCKLYLLRAWYGPVMVWNTAVKTSGKTGWLLMISALMNFTSTEDAVFI